MKKVTIGLFVPLLLAACGGTTELPTEELRGMKPACSGGDLAACADIGHAMAERRALEDLEAAE